MAVKYSCLNVTHKKPYKRYEGKTNDVLIAFIGYVNDLNKFQQFKISVQKSHHRPQCTFQPSWQQYVHISWGRLGVLALWGQHCSYCERPIRLLCLLFLSRLRFSSIPTDKNLIYTRQLQTTVPSNPLKIGHMFIWNYLLGIFPTTTSKIFTIPPETPCILILFNSEYF